MNRQQAKELWPIIKAFAEGKQIEIKTKVKGSYWDILEEDDMQYIDFKKCDLRIKPELKYRPFKDAKECWQEMQKHKPFGWLYNKPNDQYFYITALDNHGIVITAFDEVEYYDYQKLINEYTFADGSAFGIKKD